MATEQAMPLVTPVTMPDGTAVISGPIPGGGVVSATQAVARSTDPIATEFHGVSGGPFTVYGSNFGPPGLVYVGPTQVTVTSWQPHRIKGLLPVGITLKQEVRLIDGHAKETKIAYKAPAPLVAAPVPVTK